MRKFQEKNTLVQNTDFLLDISYLNLDANWTHTWKTKDKIAINLSAVNRLTNTTNTYDIKEKNNQSPNIDTLISTSNNKDLGTRLVYTGTIDYTKQFNKNIGFETGILLKHFKFDINYKDILSGIENYEKSGDYNLNYNILAHYALFTHEKNKFAYKLGVRLEYENRNINHSNISVVNEASYLNFYPSLHLSYKLKEKSTIQLSYSKKINRPHMHSLNPDTVHVESNDIRVGNPNLKPESIHSIECNYQKQFKKNSLITELYYKKTTNIISEFKTMKDEYFVYSFQNFDSDHAVGIETTFDSNLAKWWNFYVSGNIYYYSIDNAPTAQNFENKITWNVKTNTSFSLKSQTKIQFSARYNSKKLNMQGYSDSFFSIDAALSQQFFKKKLSVTASIKDIFATANQTNYIYNADFEEVSLSENFAPMILVNLSYKINNNYKSKKQQQKEDSAEEF
ncbi:MAG: TonB-dependent receptor family protein [Bacteroidales bacterium]|nr:TonB-dependent receptor family protein [Bacteroidales bacterium]